MSKKLEKFHRKLREYTPEEQVSFRCYFTGATIGWLTDEQFDRSLDTAINLIEEDRERRSAIGGDDD